MGFSDLHIHSIHSYDGTASVSAILKHVADHTDLNVIAITDHDSMEGVREALALAPRYGIEVVPGCEVSTAEGHLLALYIEQPIPAGLSLVETLKRIGAQGGIGIAAHPTARGTSSLSFEALWKVFQYPEASCFLAGVEAFNGGLVYTRSNPMTAARSKALPLAQVGNSDAHVLEPIGEGATEFFGKTAADLRRALELGSTRVRVGRRLSALNIISTYVPRYALRLLGWTAWNADPQQPVTYTWVSKTRLHHQYT